MEGNKSMSKSVITICIPSFNQEKVIAESVESALSQKGKGIKVLVVDDASTDNTVQIVRQYPVGLVVNSCNLGIGRNLERCMSLADSHYIIYLCGDDQFTHPMVVSDYINQFRSNPKLGIIGRYYYQYMNGYDGAIMVCRDKNILTQSCNPSGMAFIKDKFMGSNKIFIECPSIVAQYLQKGYEWTMLEYDTVKARIHPGGNTATKEWYYTESPIKNWTDLVGRDFTFYQGFIQLKNRAPKMLWGEICESVKINPKVLFQPLFWLYATIAVIVPRRYLIPLSNFYRHRITRRFVRIIERASYENTGNGK